MPCDTRLKPRQTIQQRAAEVRRAQQKLEAALAAGRIKPLIDKATGGIAFPGFAEADRDGVTDACIYRRVMSSGSTFAKLAIQRAEQLAGRTVNRQAVGQGLHSHDGGATWHHHKG